MNKQFCTELTLDNPVIRNHMVNGQAMLPGLAYIDILYQLAGTGLNLDYKDYILKKLSIFNPLIVSAANPVKIAVDFRKKKNYWTIQVTQAGSKPEHLYIHAELHPGKMDLNGSIDISSIKDKVVPVTGMDSIYGQAGRNGLVHQGLMKVQGSIYLTEDLGLVDLKINPDFLNAMPGLIFHPGIIDAAGMATMALIKRSSQESEENDLYLPLSYAAFYGAKPILQQSVVVIRQESIKRMNDIITHDLEFYDEEGKPVAKLTGLTAKKVRNKELVGMEPAPKIKKPALQALNSEKNKPEGEDLKVEVYLRELFSKYISVESSQIDSSDGFFDLGLESSQLLGIVSDIENKYDLSLSPVLLFEYSNIQELTEYLELTLKQEGVSSLEAKNFTGSDSSGYEEVVDSYDFFENEPYLQDHQVAGQPALPGITYPSLVLESYLQKTEGLFPVALKNIRFHGGPIGLSKKETAHIQTIFHLGKENLGFEVNYTINDSVEIKPCCSGKFIGTIEAVTKTFDIKTIIQQSKALSREKIEQGYQAKVGDYLKTIHAAYEFNSSTYILELELTGKLSKGNKPLLNFDPLILNSCLLFSNQKEQLKDKVFVPFVIERIVVYRPMTVKSYIIRHKRADKKDILSFDAIVVTENGELIAEINNASAKMVSSGEQFTKFAPMSEQTVTADKNPAAIAIIGLSGRFPGAGNVAEYWENLKNGKNSITEIPKERWDAEQFYDKEKGKEGKIYSKWGGFLSEIDKFDPLFFKISPSEAERMDPQERLFLEEAYASIEDAGYTPANLSKSKKVGVYVGVMNCNYPTGAVYWSIANRLSFIFNFYGPSMAVDTACSSSLTAIHLAAESVMNGSCECAVAGGVNLIESHFHYLRLVSRTMLSSGDKCRPFGNHADGFVDGECVAAVVLKPLEKAVQDGDHIYGVIKGSMINAGGKTGGFTVPSPAAQGDLIKDVITKAGINPRSISYIEAHGTGTELGDPIEIAGLTRAFSAFTNDKQFCAIGSVKGNIGHGESAAGIAGLIKVLLQMKYHLLVPSINADELNPNIAFEATPFFVQRKLEPWNSEKPRITGVSSFGAGGSNAHIIVEEFEPASKPPKSDSLAVIVLSAKDKERLWIKVRDFKDYLDRENIALQDIAFTLQNGREVMDARLGFTASSILELKEKLGAILSDEWKDKDILFGYAKRNNLNPALNEENDYQKMADTWIQEKQWLKIIDSWINSISFDWSKIYKNKKYSRVSLPTYPFARERYWMDADQALYGNPDSKNALSLSNQSNLYELLYSKEFTGLEFYLAGHIIQGQKMLPGVVYIEIALEAITSALNIKADDGQKILLKNLIWAYPVIVSHGPVKVNIRLVPDQSGSFYFEIFGEDNIVFSYGYAEVVSSQEKPVMDAGRIQNFARNKQLTSKEGYLTFQDLGVCYGPEMRGLNVLYITDDMVLAKLLIPESIKETIGQYHLHPALMDSAFQATVGFFGQAGKDYQLSVPYSVEEIEIIQKCSSSMWALVKKRSDIEMTFDLDIMDEDGIFCARIKGLNFKPVKRMEMIQTKQTVMYSPAWKEKELVQSLVQNNMQRVIFLCELENLNKNDIETLIPGSICIDLIPDQNRHRLSERYTSYAKKIILEMQNIIKNNHSGFYLLQGISSNDGEKALFSGLSGIFKSVHLENPNISGQWIEVEGINSKQRYIDLLQENGKALTDIHIQYQKNQRRVESLMEIEAVAAVPGIPWKDNGVWIITGGLGGIGGLIASDITSKTKNGVVILAGRSELDRDKEKQMKEMVNNGAVVDYYQLDITLKEKTVLFIQEIISKYGKIDGILHCAGVIRDNYLANKTIEDIESVLSPKVEGLVNLDEATKEIKLSCFVLFSSFAGVTGNVGQSDYAAANAFMDSYSGYRNKEVEAGNRYGKTISINWPLWKDGGMNMDQGLIQIIQEKTGIFPIETDTAVSALYRAFELNMNQILVAEGNPVKIRQYLMNGDDSVSPAGADAGEVQTQNHSVDSEGLKQKVHHYFKNIFSGVVKIPLQKIELDAPFEDYGLDSVMSTQITNQMEKQFGNLSKTLLFEYRNLNDLAEYFIKNFKDRVNILFGSEGASDIQKIEFENTSVNLKKTVSNTRFLNHEHFKALEGKDCEIAVIGMAGKYPGADNLSQFWENLKNGVDSIVEIPESRWDWRDYYSPDKNIPGKTYSKWGGFINGVDEFDPLFFNISPREAELMDPQERLFLECVYSAVEDSGYTPGNLGGDSVTGSAGNVGVYAGVMYDEYQLYGGQEHTYEMVPPLVGTHSTIANRVSYVLNFQGPCIALDTMCSSSLTAMHLACQSIQKGECTAAIAGGVNISIHPKKYLFLSMGNFASSKGRCESFGKGGDGYVPGEGVGAFVLKSLPQAVKDKDPIYGILKSTSINSGGRTNGYTVPNPNAQSKLIMDSIDKAGISARDISYIEAHGTGTSLGDPIELTGLTSAFKRTTGERQFCAIGSVKSNIGHCESASGVAAVTKVLLQMKYKKLVPSLHSKELNPNIDFDETPFFVQQEYADWVSSKPRIAGVSSFGAGGSNAHIIIEEYQDQNAEYQSEGKQAVIVLSARDEVRLKEKAEDLLKYLDKKGEEKSLFNIAYTLQVGREPMEERLGFIVQNLEELKEKLTGFIQEKSDGIEFYQGNIKRNKEAYRIFQSDDDLSKAIDNWIQKNKYFKLIELWVNGLTFEWNRLYGNNRPVRVHLPAYPFARDSFWIKNPEVLKSRALSKVLHPLVQENISSFREQKFSSIFDGTEFFLRDHNIFGVKVMPGSVYMMMAKVAVGIAAEMEQNNCYKFKNILWLNPFAVDKTPEKLNIGLSFMDNGDISYRIYSGNSRETEKIHSQGLIEIRKETEKIKLNIHDKQNQVVFHKEKIYSAFESAGITYGASLRGIETITGDENTAIVELSLPAGKKEDEFNYIKQLSMIDFAIQSTAGLMAVSGQRDTALPFSIESVEIFGESAEIMRAIVKFNDPDRKLGFDIDLCDVNGEVIIRLKKLMLIQAEHDGQKKNPEIDSEWEGKEMVEISPDGYEIDVDEIQRLILGKISTGGED